MYRNSSADTLEYITVVSIFLGVLFVLKYDTMAQFHNQGFTLVLILIIADQILNGSLCCSKKYN